MRQVLRFRVSTVIALALVVAACGDDGGSGGGEGAAGGAGGGDAGGPSDGGTGGGSGAGDATGGGGAAEGGGGGGGGGSCIDTSGFTYVPHKDGSPECLDVPSASSFCGFDSDEAICGFAVECGISKDVGQCKINCEQGSSSFCNPPEAVECVVAAYCAEDCDALAACPFIL